MRRRRSALRVLAISDFAGMDGRLEVWMTLIGSTDTDSQWVAVPRAATATARTSRIRSRDITVVCPTPRY